MTNAQACAKATEMSGREKLQLSLSHREGTIPLDMGATAVTGTHVSCLAALREHFGLSSEPVKVLDPYQMLGLPENDILDVLGADVGGVCSPITMFGFENKNWKEWKSPWGQVVLVGEDFQVDETGEHILIYPGGDRSVPASGRMARSGYFFDTIIRQEPLDMDNLRVEDNLEEFGPIADHVLLDMKRQVGNVRATGRGIVANISGTAFGDIAIVPGPFLKHPKGIRDITEWYMTVASKQDFVHAVFARQLEIALKNLARIYETLGNDIDVVNLCGTDFGTQSSTFCSPKTFKNLWHPYYKVMNDWVHSNTKWKTFKHSCGAVAGFLPLFIEAGFDIINPVQCSAKGMDPQTIKDAYGDRLVFWGGGIDTQHMLPFGTPQQVREQVLERCAIFSKNGGYVFNTIHNIQAKTPTANLIALFGALREFNGKT
ncbi:methyltransferase [Planctomycetales bacterium]|nr:methyltransferase [Planctomycetales bacterium]